ncbi:MAG: ABC transporter permease [Clostridiaceae bacterium]
MKLRHIWIVFKKEVMDLTRDKRTIMTSILVPMLIVPLLNIIMGGGAEKFTKGLNENVTIALSEASNTADIKELVQNKLIVNNPNLVLMDVDNPSEALKNEQIRCILDFEEGFKEKLEQGQSFKITLLYDESKTKSQASVDIVASAIEQYKEGVVSERITALGLNKELLQPVVVERNNVAENKQGSNMMLLMMLPMMVGLLVSIGGIPAATDLVAGEKERKTFEPLLTTMPNRGSLLAGKYLAVTLFSFVSVIAIVAGMVIGYMINRNTLTMGIGSQIAGFELQPMAALLTVVITIALGMTFSGIQIALSAFARSYKEAQTYLSFLMIIAMVPGYMTMFLQPGDLKTYMFAVPVLNTIAAFKMILGGVVNYSNLILALATSVIFVAATLWLAASLFKKEKVLFRN